MIPSLRAKRSNPVTPSLRRNSFIPRPWRFSWIAASAFGLLAMTMQPALAAPLVADLSNYRIDIDSGFNGTRIFLFGARNDNGDIAVVIRGPQKDYIVRKKKEIAGLW